MDIRNRILISGGTGYLGSRLAKMLRDQGFEVTCLLRRNQKTLSPTIAEKCYISDSGALDCGGLDGTRILACLNCAVSYGRTGETPEEVFNANCYFPVRFLELSEKLGIPYFFNCMTSIPKILNTYTFTKHMFSEWAHFFTKHSHVKFINCKLEHFFGPGENPKNKFIAFLYEKIKNNEPVPLTQGEQLRDFIYIDDVVQAFKLIFQNISIFSEPFSTVDIGCGHPLRIREAAETIKELLKSTSELQFGKIPYRENEIMFSSADTTFLKKLGWTPKINFTEAVQKIMKEDHR